MFCLIYVLRMAGMSMPAGPLFFADDLSVKFHVDNAIGIPAFARKDFVIEPPHVIELMFESVEWPEHDGVVTDTWHELHVSVVEHVDLYDIVAPEIIVMEKARKFDKRQDIALVDMTGDEWQPYGRTARNCHQLAFMIDKEIALHVPILIFDTIEALDA